MAIVVPSALSKAPTSFEQFNRLSPQQQREAILGAIPDQWLKVKTGEELWSKQAEILRDVAVYPRVAVASCNGAGKSYLAARAAIWFLHAYPNALVVTTAPTNRQVQRIIWREIHLAAARAEARGYKLPGKLLTTMWKVTEEWIAYGFSTRDDATAFQGLHADHIFIIADEGAGITEPVWEGIFSCLRGGHSRLLVIGNPTTVDTRFYTFFSSANWRTHYISAFDTPNLQGRGIIVPGLVTAEDVENAKEDWGEDSPIYMSRIYGRFPDASDNTLIPLSLVTAAGDDRMNWMDLGEFADEDKGLDIGADFARYGGDTNAFVARQGRFAFMKEEFGSDSLGTTGLMTVAGRLVQFVERARRGRHLPHVRIKLDAVGLGGGIPDRLRELQIEGRLDPEIEIYEMNAGGKPKNEDLYKDAGTEHWHELLKRLKAEEAYGPVFAEKRLIGELTRRKYSVLSNGKMKLESKDELRKRGLRSPDLADAVAFAFYEPPAPLKQAPTPTSVGASYWSDESMGGGSIW